MRSKVKKNILFFVTMFSLLGCKTIPEGVKAIQPFDKNRYLGKWYEIARFDLKFEKNLINTTATYSLNSDGTIKVLNKGFDTVNKKWKQANGKAKFVGKDSVAMLKVSFFGPFYGGYNVIAIDSEYKYAMVCGSSTSYLWILSKEKSIPEDIKVKYLDLAKYLGFNVDVLLWVKHDQ